MTGAILLTEELCNLELWKVSRLEVNIMAKYTTTGKHISLSTYKRRRYGRHKCLTEYVTVIRTV